MDTRIRKSAVHGKTMIDADLLYEIANRVAGPLWVVTLVAKNALIEEGPRGQQMWAVTRGSRMTIRLNRAYPTGPGGRTFEVVLGGAQILAMDIENVKGRIEEEMERISTQVRSAEMSIATAGPRNPQIIRDGVWDGTDL